MDVSYTTHTSEIRLSLGKRFGRGEEGGGTLVNDSISSCVWSAL